MNGAGDKSDLSTLQITALFFSERKITTMRVANVC